MAMPFVLHDFLKSVMVYSSFYRNDEPFMKLLCCYGGWWLSFISGELSSLEELILVNCSLYGNFPNELAALTSLSLLDLSYNNLDNISSTVSELISLQTLRMDSFSAEPQGMHALNDRW